MELIIFAGPNGSGKSTLINDYLSNPKHQGLHYVCPDAIFSHLYPDPPTDEEKYKKCYIEAMEMAETTRNKLINDGVSFIFETVFSTSEKVSFIKEAKEKGFSITANFVTTNSPKINIKRVALRVKQGGHDVPEEKIISRYQRSMEQLPYLFKLADILNIYDNSSTKYELVYQHTPNQYYVNYKFRRTALVRKHILPNLKPWRRGLGL